MFSNHCKDDDVKPPVLSSHTTYHHNNPVVPLDLVMRAPSGRSHCIQCGELIPKGSVRVGKQMWIKSQAGIDFGYHPRWYHQKCIPASVRTTLRLVAPSIEEECQRYHDEILVLKQVALERRPILLKQLRRLRKQLLKQGRLRKKPLSNQSLMDLVVKMPQTYNQLREVYGLGPAKCHEYGLDILETIDKYNRNMAKLQDRFSLALVDNSAEIKQSAEDEESIKHERNGSRIELQGEMSEDDVKGESSVDGVKSEVRDKEFYLVHDSKVKQENNEQCECFEIPYETASNQHRFPLGTRVSVHVAPDLWKTGTVVAQDCTWSYRTKNLHVCYCSNDTSIARSSFPYRVRLDTAYNGEFSVGVPLDIDDYVREADADDSCMDHVSEETGAKATFAADDMPVDDASISNVAALPNTPDASPAALPVPFGVRIVTDTSSSRRDNAADISMADSSAIAAAPNPNKNNVTVETIYGEELKTMEV